MVNRPGKQLDVSPRRKVVVIPTCIHHVRPGVSCPLNDNYCVNVPELTEPRYCKLISVSPGWTSVRRDSKSSVSTKCCKLSSCKSCTYLKRAARKERHRSGCCESTSRIKICEQCLLCRLIVFCQVCTKCPNCCSRSTCRGKTSPVSENLGNFGGWTKGHKNAQKKVTPSLSRPGQI